MSNKLNNPCIYVIIVNFNRLFDTIECVDSIFHQSYKNYKIIIIDNGSSDGSPEFFTNLYPNIIVIKNRKNLGFSAGINKGILYALENQADYVFLLNNDTFLFPDTLEKLVRGSSNKNFGISAPIILNYSNPQKIWSAGGKISLYTLQMIDNHGRRNTFLDETERDFVTGCAMLIHRETLKTVGLFDERFFLYYEDADFCHRVKYAGLKIFLIPHSRILHKVSQSTGGAYSIEERYWMAKSSIIFFKKNASLLQLIIIIPGRIVNYFKVIYQLFMNNNISAIKSYTRGIIDGLKTHI